MTHETVFEPLPTNKAARWLVRAEVILLGGLLLLAAWLRWRFVVMVQPYPDEFATLLAVQMILEKGIPVLPSGLFYEHGLLFSYLGAAASSLFGFGREVVRLASLSCGVLTVGLVWWVGRRWFSPPVGLLAATLLTLAPEAIIWSGRARMYALLQVLTLLTLWLAFEAAQRGSLRWGWMTLAALLATLLSHFVAITLVPPLLVFGLGMVWLGQSGYLNRSGRRLWILAAQAIALLAVVATAFLVKRAGQPKGIDPLESDAGGLAEGIQQVWQIYSALSLDWAANWAAIGPFFTAPAVQTSSLFALIAVGVGLWAAGHGDRQRKTWATLFLGGLLALTTLEMLLLVAPDRRDDKYLFMLLPALLLLAGQGVLGLVSSLAMRLPRYQSWVTALGGLVLATLVLWPLATQATATLARTGLGYDAAFAYVQAAWQPGDQILTGTPAAAAYYLGRNDYYAVRADGGYAYRLLPGPSGPVERWLGSPWLGSDDELHAVLSSSNRIWVVLERWGLLDEYYDPLTRQRLLAMTTFEREERGVIVLRSQADAPLLPATPAVPTQVNFDYKLTLQGYSLHRAGRTLTLSRQWSVMNTLPVDYVLFLHLRNAAGDTVAQADTSLLSPVYPTTLWPVGDVVREQSALLMPQDLPPGEYQLWLGLYDLATLERLPLIGDSSGENAFLVTTVEVP